MVFWLGQTEGFLAGFAGKKQKKYERLLGADRRYSLRIRVIKRWGKTKREKAFSQGSCGKMQGKKQEKEKAFFQGSRDKTQGGNFENKLEFVSGNADADRNAGKEHTRLATPSPP